MRNLPKTTETDFPCRKYPVVHILCTQLSDEKFYVCYYEILIVGINNEWNVYKIYEARMNKTNQKEKKNV